VAVGERSGELVRTRTGAVAGLSPSVGPAHAPRVLSTTQLRALDEVILEAEHSTGLRFAVYVGELGEDTRAGAERLLDALGEDAPYAVLVALSPGQRVVEIVTGSETALRISDRAARVAVLAVVAACSDGDLNGALINAVRILADQAGTVPERSDW
jgi:hypothetical protein